MTKRRKLLWMFLPLAAAFIGMTVVVVDLKQPTLSTDQCQAMGRGASVQAFKGRAHWLYGKGGRTADDIGLRCAHHGDVMLNEDVPLPLQPGAAVSLRERRYHVLPTRYYLDVPVVNPTDAAAEPSTPPAVPGS